MRIVVQVILNPDEPASDLALASNDYAAAILKVFKGKPTDYCTVQINDLGTAGTNPVEPPPATPVP